MANAKLTPKEQEKLIKAINSQSEVSMDLLQKLSPSFFEKLAQDGQIDFKKLNKYKIPTIEYEGKRPESVILSQASLHGGSSPLQVERCFEHGEAKNGRSQLAMFEESKKQDPNWRNLIVQGDNLQFLKACYLNKNPLIKDKVKGKVKLIYIDPPFGTGDEYGGKGGEMSYSAKVQNAEYIELLRERLIFLREILSKDGVIFVRIDYHFGHYIKAILDEVFGSEHFQNEIVINRFKRMLRGLTKFNIAVDSLFFYSKTKNFSFGSLERDRTCTFCGNELEPVWRGMSSPGLRRPPERKIFGKMLLPPKGRHWTFRQERIEELVKENRIRVNLNISYKDLDGKRIKGLPEYLQTSTVPVDNNWTDLKGYVFASKYPTENPEPLLERVIKSAGCKDNDLIVDTFAGSGTTGAVAEKLGMRWIMCDFGKHSIYYMQKRILRIAESKKLGKGVKKNQKYGKGPNPFCVISVGGYDFSRVMNLRENKEAYINFVLGLFGLGKSENDLVKKYKLPNVYAEKENNPVEVYPVWEDNYLKKIKIDQDYLQSIIDQTKGRLKGDYYIITPVSCTNISDISLPNAKKENVNFKLLSFPYKILEEAARFFSIHEQPSSPSNINDLISSVGYYFNEKVTIKAKKSKEGFKITSFKSNIADSKGDKFEGLDGLAMILLDKDHDKKVFDMEEAIYAKDIGESGLVKASGITKDSYIIAVDKHGNESAPTQIHQ